MALALSGIRLFLAVVFAVAGITKLRGRTRFSRTLSELGLPPALVPVSSVGVPVLEVATAVMLLADGSAATGAALATLLLAAFTITAAVSLLRGTVTDCACFGSVTEERIGPSTIFRNAVLMALAVLIVFRGPGNNLLSLGGAWRQATADDRLIAVAFLTSLIVLAISALQAARVRAENAQLMARVTTLERKLQSTPASQDLGAGGLDVGLAAPAFSLPRLEGDRASLASLVDGRRPVALVFLSSHCSACHELWPDIERWQARGTMTIAAICSGSPQTIELRLMGFSISNVLLEGDAKVAEAYALSLRPSAVIVNTAGAIDSRSVAGVAAIRALVAERT